MKKIVIWKFAILVSMSSLIFCCRTEQDKKKIYYDKAKACYESQNYICARDALEKAVLMDPNMSGLTPIWVKYT
jgi:hypothetical protein